MRVARGALADLEAEAIHVLREVAAQFTRPVLMYSIGKDSTVLLELARRAFAPAPMPFPLLHVDTGWKFREMIEFRDAFVRRLGLRLHVWVNTDAAREGITPFSVGTQRYTQAMKTEALRQALDTLGFDAAIGGARRDEERSRAKERVFSLRDRHHRWDARNQRPELWRLLVGRMRAGQTMRAFPLSNWTEHDVWEYVQHAGLEVVPLYFAAERPVVQRNGMWIMRDDARLPLEPGETVTMRRVRFRTLGCYPLTGAIESSAVTVPAILDELRQSRWSERQGRAIDHDEGGSMEDKKREGYF